MSSYSDMFNKITVKMLSRLESINKEDGRGKLIYVTSSSDQEGKSFITELLAYYSASLTNNKVLIIDANMDKPSIASDYSFKNTEGLSDYLVNQDVSNIKGHATNLANLHVISAGTKCKSGLLFKKHDVEQIINKVTDIFDLVFVDSSSVVRSGANSLASLADGVVLVIDSTSTKREVMQYAMQELNLIQDKVLGVILNKRRQYIPKRIYKVL